jgi:Tfp pilus assembly protein PilX
VSLVLLFAMLMTAAYAHRSLLLEQRLSANQYREAQAFEAAQSGIDWAIAQINQARPLNERCEPVASAASRSFRERFLASDTASGRH